MLVPVARWRSRYLLGGGLGVAALLYWQIVLAEGAYLGPRVVRLLYHFGAPHYDAIRQPWQADADALLRPLLQAALADLQQPWVLDVATGTGRVPLLLWAEPTFAGYIAALDLTPAMLAEARRKAQARYPEAQIGWHQAEAGQLPWATARFDLVTCLEALEYVPHPRRALAEMVRVLRPGGTLLVSKIPDNWARLLPGRAFTRQTLTATLQRLGCVDVACYPWQHGHYELVSAHAHAKP